MMDERNENKSVHWKWLGTRSALLVSLALLFSLTVGGTLAYIATKTEAKENQFVAANVACEVVKGGNTSSVTNTGNVDAYIRAAIVVNWVDSAGNVSGTAPTSTQYALDINDIVWEELDGYYYCKNRVTADGGSTGDLITSINVEDNAPSGYELSVEVVAEAIQADGKDTSGKSALELSWGAAAAQWVGLN